APRGLHPAAAGAGGRLVARPVRVARTEGSTGRIVCADVARVAAAGRQLAARGGMRLGAARHALSADSRRAWPGQDLRRGALFQYRVRAAHGTHAVSDGRRSAGTLEARRTQADDARTVDRRRARGDRRYCNSDAHGWLDTADGRWRPRSEERR